MRIIKNETTETYQEIEIEKSFLFLKWKIKYRKIDGNIFRFKYPDRYYNTGLIEYFEVKQLFKIKP